MYSFFVNLDIIFGLSLCLLSISCNLILTMYYVSALMYDVVSWCSSKKSPHWP